MKFTQEEVYFNANRKVYWTRISVESELGKKATILVCAPRNMVSDHYRIPSVATEKDAERFFGEVIMPDIKEKFEGVDLNAPVYYEPYFTTQEGFRNGMEFLQKEIAP